MFSVIDSTLRARAFYPYGIFLDDQPDFDAIVDFDGATPTAPDVKLFIRTTQDDCWIAYLYELPPV